MNAKRKTTFKCNKTKKPNPNETSKSRRMKMDRTNHRFTFEECHPKNCTKLLMFLYCKKISTEHSTLTPK